MAHKVNKEFVQEALETLESEIAQIQNGIYMSCKLRSKLEEQLKEIKALRREYARTFGGLSTKYIDKAVPEIKEQLEQRQNIIKTLRSYLKEKFETRAVFLVASEQED